jgi:hypothetical protein
VAKDRLKACGRSTNALWSVLIATRSVALAIVCSSRPADPANVGQEVGVAARHARVKREHLPALEHAFDELAAASAWRLRSR